MVRINMKNKLIKTACLTDIHWGAKSNSELHNQDCDRYIDWFCDQVKNDPSIDSIFFLGDWYESRSALNIQTLNYSHVGAKKLNDLGLPVFFVIGNHDLYNRNTRALYSTITFEEFSNFTIINEPTVINKVHNGILICPYLFHDEYATLAPYLNLDTWWGHFEFKGFVVTGYNMKMPTGPDPSNFIGPKHIFSGHFHKRQTEGNITYIGNTFPTNFGDAGDFNRGMMVYDHVTSTPSFLDWVECPKYIKIPLSEILDGQVTLYKDSRVKCLVDIPISFEESSFLKTQFINQFDLREFSMEESPQLEEALRDTQTSSETQQQLHTAEDKLDSVDDLVIQMLSDIKVDQIDNTLLIAQYQKLVSI